MNGSKKASTGGVSVNVPVQRVSLGGAGTPNTDALTEEDKEVLGGFSVPVGRTSERAEKTLDTNAARLAALAKAREIKRQKANANNASPPQKSEPSSSDNGVSFDDTNDDSLVQTSAPLVDDVPNTPIKPSPSEPRSDTPPLISPERKRKILQMLSDLPDEEDEEEERTNKKRKVTTEDVADNGWRNFVADKALDFGRFVAATALTAVVVGTVKTMAGSYDQTNPQYTMNPNWIRQ